jgi:hypothetical protein
MPGAPYTNWLTLAFLIGVTASFALTPETRVALYVAPIWFVLLYISYRRMNRLAGSAVTQEGPWPPEELDQLRDVIPTDAAAPDRERIRGILRRTLRQIRSSQSDNDPQALL